MGTRLAAPLMREGMALGVIMIRRAVVQPFTSEQIGSSRRSPTKQLSPLRMCGYSTRRKRRWIGRRQRVRSCASSPALPTDAQPVFDAIVQRAAPLVGPWIGTTRVVGNMLHLQAFITGTQGGDDAVEPSFQSLSVPTSRCIRGLSARARRPSSRMSKPIRCSRGT